MTYQEAMAYIESMWQVKSNYCKERTKRMLDLLGNPHEALKLIHVAGTNGKGSTCTMIAAILQKMGYKVGLYTTPWLEVYEEKIQINGSYICKEQLTAGVQRLKEVIEIILKEGYSSPTEFEMMTVLALFHFYEERVDFAVIEVGLGGEKDATNVITPLVSVITSISKDHMQVLGEDLLEIAKHKAGIIKAGVPVICYPQEEAVSQLIRAVAREKGALLDEIITEDGSLLALCHEKATQQISIKGKHRNYVVHLALLGQHQILNAAVAIRAVESICESISSKLEPSIVEEALSKVKWPGRLEVLAKAPFVVIDGAHNIEGITALSKNVPTYFKYKKLYLLLGILADKEVSEMAKTIAPLADEIYALTPQSYRAAKNEALKKALLPYHDYVSAEEDYETALKKALGQATKDDLILISGSLYLIGTMRPMLQRLLGK